MSDTAVRWTAAGSEAATRLTEHVRQLPRAGIHRWPVSVVRAPDAVHPANTTIYIGEEHGGFAYGGNKVRQVDALLARALAAGADSVITSAGPQSNLCRVVAAGARATGLEPFLVLRGTPPDEPTGNQALYELAGASLTWVATDDPYDSRQRDAMEKLASGLRARGRQPYILDVRDEAGVLCTLASTAVVDELERTLAVEPARIVIAGGAGNTAAGILAALAARRSSVELLVVSVASADAAALRERVLARAAQALDRAGLSADGLEGVGLEVTARFLGGGHGVPTPEGIAAQRTVARACGIFLDPTYTAKAMAAVLADGRPGPILFLHTGGGPTVFARQPAHGR